MVLTTTLNKTLPHGMRPTIPSGTSGDSAQALRPTFDGWGPRL
jgi:hypothetical protein